MGLARQAIQMVQMSIAKVHTSSGYILVADLKACMQKDGPGLYKALGWRQVGESWEWDSSDAAVQALAAAAANVAVEPVATGSDAQAVGEAGATQLQVATPADAEAVGGAGATQLQADQGEVRKLVRAVLSTSGSYAITTHMLRAKVRASLERPIEAGRIQANGVRGNAGLLGRAVRPGSKGSGSRGSGATG